MKNQTFYFTLAFAITCTVFSKNAIAQLHVVATTPDFASIAKEIGGDKIELVTLARATEDPHFVDAKPSFVVKLNRADVLIEGGAELEIGWLPALLDQSRNEKIAVGAPGHISCAQVVELAEVPVSLDRSRGDVHAAGNPHYMVDPVNAGKVAGLITESFCSLDAPSCQFFRSNLKTFSSQISMKIEEWQKKLAPFKGARIVAYHNSWPYFAKRFGLNIDLFLEPKPGIPPTPANLADVILKMRTQRIKVILVDPYFNRRTAEAVASKTDGQVIDVAQYPGGIVGTEAGYIALLDNVVQKLAEGLGRP